MDQVLVLRDKIEKRKFKTEHARLQMIAPLFGATVKDLEEVMPEQGSDLSPEQENAMEKLAMKKLAEMQAKHGERRK